MEQTNINRLILILAVCCLELFVCSSAMLAQDSVFGNQAPPPTPSAEQEVVVEGNWTKIVRPSKIMERVREKFRESPDISAKALAAFANEILNKEGFDFTFSWIPKGKKNEANLASLGSGYWPFFRAMTATNGKKLDFYLMNDDFDHPCFSAINIPVTRVAEKGFTVVSGEEKIPLIRPKDFVTEEMVLVAKDMKKVIRKWKTPIDATPIGISLDGTKIYLDTYQFHQDPNDNNSEKPMGLSIEISSTGAIKFVDVKNIPSDNGIDMDHDKKYTEITYTKYKVKGKEYIVKYSAPCT